MRKRLSALPMMLALFNLSCSEFTQEQIAKIDSLEQVYDGKLVQIAINDSIGIPSEIKDGQWVLLESFDLPFWAYAHLDNAPTPELLKVQLDVKENNETHFIHYRHIKEFESVK